MSTSLRSKQKTKYRFTTRDLVTIAVLSALGGVLSTYVGYLGNLVNRMLGVPFGAGQFMAGLHVFWIVMAYGIIKKTGAGTITGLLKGVVELLTGSTHGIIIVLVSAVQGIIYDAGMTGVRNKNNLPANYLSAGAAAASNVFVFQFIYLAAVPFEYILLISILAFSSGIIFGGYFGRSTLDNLIRSDVVRDIKKVDRPRRRIYPNQVVALMFVGCFMVGAIYYYTNVYSFFDEDGCEITGDVEYPYVYKPSDFNAEERTVNAELKGSYTYVALKNYTGVPLSKIISRAEPKNATSKVIITARDGYEADFSLIEIMSNDDILLIEEDSGFRVVSPVHDGAYWVEQVVTIKVS